MPFKSPEARRAWREANRHRQAEYTRRHRASGREAQRERQRKAEKAAAILSLPDKERALHYIMSAGHYSRIQSAVATYIREHAPKGGPTDDDRNASARHRARMRMATIERLGGRCECCGIDEPLVLEFDHRTPVQRRTNGVRSHDALALCRAILRGDDVDVQLLCSNCHTIKTRGNGEYGLNPLSLFNEALDDSELWGD